MIDARHMPGQATQRAFTIVEMVIALVLVGVVMAVALPTVSNMLGFSNRAAAQSQSTGDSQYLAMLLENDLRQAAAPRSFGLAVGTSVVVSLGSTAAAAHDLIFAGPQAITFWSDVAPTPGPEVVRWYLVQNSPMCDAATARKNWCVVRDVISGPAVALPAGGTLRREVVANGVGSFPSTGECAPGIPVSQRLFCFKHEAPATYAWAGWRPACFDQWAVAAPWNVAPGRGAAGAVGEAGPGVALGSSQLAVAHSKYGAPTRISSLDTITGVGIVAPAGGRVDGDSARSLLPGGVDLRNRTTSEYRTAILCGAR